MSKKEINIEQLEREKDRNDIISNFLELPSTQELLKKYQLSATGSPEFSRNLNKSFQAYFSYVLFLSYLNKSLYFKSIHIKKRDHNINQNNMPLDASDIYQLPILSESIDVQLLKNLPWRSVLTSRQLFVLNKIYIEGYQQNEVAELLQITPAAINKIKKTSLVKIKQYIEDKDKNHDI